MCLNFSIVNIRHCKTCCLNANSEPLLPPDEDADEATRRDVIALLSVNAVEIDDLIREAQCQPEAVMAVLLELEVAGRLIRSAGGMVALNRS